jgi:nitrogen regulatory protein PII
LPKESAVKWVRAVIRPSRLDDVVDALCAIGITRLTVTEVQCYGEATHDASVGEDGEDPEYRPASVPRVQIEAALPDERLADAIDTLVRPASTGTVDEGRIIVLALERAMRIRTGETGESAL